MTQQQDTMSKTCDCAAIMEATTRGLGFTPTDSVVIGGVAGDGELVVCMRFDWDAPVDAVAEYMLNMTVVNDVEFFVVVGYDKGVTVVLDTALVDTAAMIAPVIYLATVTAGMYQVHRGCQGCQEPTLLPGIAALPSRADLLKRLLPGDEPHPPVALGTREQRRAVEDAAMTAVVLGAGPDGWTAWSTPGIPQIEAMFAVAQHVHARDPFVRRLIEEDRVEAAAQLALATIQHYRPSAMLYALAALLFWMTGHGPQAIECAEQAQELDDPRATLADLVDSAVRYGLPPSTWAQVSLDIPMGVLRGGLQDVTEDNA